MCLETLLGREGIKENQGLLSFLPLVPLSVLGHSCVIPTASCASREVHEQAPKFWGKKPSKGSHLRTIFSLSSPNYGVLMPKINIESTMMGWIINFPNTVLLSAKEGIFKIITKPVMLQCS